MECQPQYFERMAARVKGIRLHEATYIGTVTCKQLSLQGRYCSRRMCAVNFRFACFYDPETFRQTMKVCTVIQAQTSPLCLPLGLTVAQARSDRYTDISAVKYSRSTIQVCVTGAQGLRSRCLGLVVPTPMMIDL